MWNNQSQRPKASKKRDKDRIRMPIHIKRICAELELVNAGNPQGKIEVRVILNDLSPKGMQLFSTEPFISGQDIKLKITDPIAIEVSAKVRWCQEHNASSHVISNRDFSYRLGIEFVVNNPEEQQAIKLFYDEITRKYLYTHKAV